MYMKSYAMDNIKILKLDGRFDNYTSSSIQSWLEEETNNKNPQIVVNLGGVEFVDSTALAILVQGMKRCRQHGGDVRLCQLQQQVRMIFELTRLDNAFEIFATEEEAVQAFR